MPLACTLLRHASDDSIIQKLVWCGPLGRSTVGYLLMTCKISSCYYHSCHQSMIGITRGLFVAIADTYAEMVGFSDQCCSLRARELWCLSTVWCTDLQYTKPYLLPSRGLTEGVMPRWWLACLLWPTFGVIRVHRWSDVRLLKSASAQQSCECSWCNVTLPVLNSKKSGSNTHEFLMYLNKF